mmetsp:Transcript_54978/g.178002  ORF Transcript_54978/g.178002 Transcript_54978/m.178002 type:complete len:363 (+) Transcript_54978:345-1433(+)
MLKEVSGDKPYTQDVARKRGFKFIGVASRGDLCDYLVGRNETCRGLVHEVLEGRKRPLDDRTDDPLAPKRRSSVAGKAAVAKVGVDVVAVVRSGSAKDFKITDLCYADVQERVRPVKDLDMLARCPGRMVPNADLILKIAQDEVNNWHSRRRDEQPERVARTKQPFIGELEGMLAEDKAANPIILVPCSKLAPVNLLNALQFLQEGEYFKTDAEHTKFFESTRKEFVEVVRNVRGRMWTFEVRDSAKNFTKSQWLRVVAVITDGSDWQFVGWPFRTVVDLFTSTKGVFFRENGTLTPLHVRDWAVSILEMQPLQFQHRYAEVRDEFWVEVGNFLQSSRMKKFSNSTALAKVRVSTEKALPVL